MEVVKYICEFFFGNFWHFLGLFVIICAVGNANLFTINIWKKKNSEEENQNE